MRTANLSSSKPARAQPVRPGAAVLPAPSPGEANTLRPLVEWLAAMGTTPHWVVSCYLKLEPRDRARGKYLIKLKNRSRDRLTWLEERGVAKQERELVARDLERIRDYLAQPDNLPTGQGIAIFASEPLELFEAVPLPRVFRSRLAIDRSPLIRELAALDDEFGLVVCAVCDRTEARFFEVTAFGIEELPGVAAGDATRASRFHGPRAQAGSAAGAGSPGEHNYHQRIREEKQRHYALVAQRLFELARAQPIRGVVLAGVGADADAVRPHLHPYLARHVLGITKLNPKTATVGEVMEAVLEVRRESERQWEAEHVAELTEALGTGWAVNGIEAVLDVLAHGQVRSLLVDPTVERPGYRCAQTGRLQTQAQGCHGEGDAVPVPDVVDEAIEEALRQGSHVEVVEDARARAELDGLAALLRFKRR